MLALSVLAAIAVAAIRSGRTRTLVAVVAIVLIGMEYTHVPLPLEGAPRPSEVHSYIASSRVDGSVLELPTVTMDKRGVRVPGSIVREAWYAAFSTKHWRPILNGYSGFLPPTHEEMVEKVQDFPSDDSIRFLRGRRVAFVIIHLDAIPDTPWSDLADGIRDPSLKLVMDDGQARLYRILNNIDDSKS
jgi:hypothetical protein